MSVWRFSSIDNSWLRIWTSQMLPAEHHMIHGCWRLLTVFCAYLPGCSFVQRRLLVARTVLCTFFQRPRPWGVPATIDFHVVEACAFSRGRKDRRHFRCQPDKAPQGSNMIKTKGEDRRKVHVQVETSIRTIMQDRSFLIFRTRTCRAILLLHLFQISGNILHRGIKCYVFTYRYRYHR